MRTVSTHGLVETEIEIPLSQAKRIAMMLIAEAYGLPDTRENKLTVKGDDIEVEESFWSSGKFSGSTTFPLSNVIGEVPPDLIKAVEVINKVSVS